MRRLRVLELVSSLEKAGMERMVYDLCRLLDPGRFAVTAACLSHRGEYADPLEAAGVEVIDLAKKDGLDLVVPLRLVSILARRRIDLIHIHNSWPLFAGVTAAILARTRHRVYTEHGRQWPDRSRTTRIDRFLTGRCGAVTAVAKSQAESLVRYLGVDRARLSVLANGAGDLAAEDLTPPADLFDQERGPTIGFAGRLERVKGVDVLLAAMPRVIERVPGVRLLVCGEGDEEQALVGQAESLGIAGRVRFTGWRYDVPAILKGLDALVLASRSEGMPMTILEAFSLSVPVAATAVGGVPEVVVDGETGCLAPPEDPDALADAIAGVVADPARRQAMGARAREVFERGYTIETMVRRYEALFDRLAGRGVGAV